MRANKIKATLRGVKMQASKQTDWSNIVTLGHKLAAENDRSVEWHLIQIGWH